MKKQHLAKVCLIMTVKTQYMGCLMCRMRVKTQHLDAAKNYHPMVCSRPRNASGDIYIFSPISGPDRFSEVHI